MNLKALFLILIMIQIGFTALADTSHFINKKNKINFSSITPEEDYGSLVTEQSFYTVASRVYSLYASEAQKFNRKLIIKTLDWKTPYFSAWAAKESEGDEVYSINFWGGLARLPHMTDAAFALTACHEVGHILGGKPYINISSLAHMTSEGQSDFFASALCLKKYDQIFKLPIETEVDPYLTSRCYEKFNESAELETCLKVGVAGISLARALAFLSNYSELDVAAPSKEEVSETLFNSYPSVQCRLDTFISGALSRFDESNPLESPDAHLRPKCWFVKSTD